MKTRNVGTTLSMLGLLSLMACGAEAPVESPDAEACEHLKEGPSSSVTAAQTGTADAAPAVAANHTRHDITLVDVQGAKGGAVKFSSAEATQYRVSLNKDVPFAVKDSAGAAVAIEETLTDSAECTELKARHTFELGVGTYTFEFGPTAETEVGMVIEEAAHDEHAGH